ASGNRNRTYIRVIDTFTGATIERPVNRVNIPRVDLLSNDRNLSYSSSGFEVDLKVSELPSQREGASLGSNTWKIEAYVEHQGVYAQGPVEWRDRSGAAAHLDLAELQSGAGVVPRSSAVVAREVYLDQLRYILEGIDLDVRALKMKVRAPGNAIPVEIEAF